MTGVKAQQVLARLGWVMLVGLIGFYLWAIPSTPLTDDDDFYLPAGASYASWLLDAAQFKRRAWTKEGIDAAFSPNHEHPPLAKYGLGLAGRVFGPWLGPVAGPRVSTVLFGVLAVFSMIWMAREGLGIGAGTIVGMYAAILLLCIPRWFFHSKVGTLDVPVAGMYLWTAALGFRAERSVRAAWLVGPAFGLATATKLNAPFFFFAYAAYAVTVRKFGGMSKLRELKDAASEKVQVLELPRLPIGLISCAVLGPVTFFLVWPWMWFDTANRVREYIGFHLEHYGIYFLYFGRLYDQEPFAPWTMPFVMTAITVPVAVLMLAVVGLFPWLRPAQRSLHRLWLWVLVHAVVTVGTVAFSGGAKYGGTKLFLPLFPFLSLMAGLGAFRLWSLCNSSYRWAVSFVLVLAPLSGLVQLVNSREAPLSQYNALAGGLRGATAGGFERQYYDLAFHDLVEYLNTKAPPGTQVHFLPNNWEYERTFRWYRKEGRLREDIRVAARESRADWVVLTHERRFRRYSSDLQRMRALPLVYERRLDGVPLWSILQRR